MNDNKPSKYKSLCESGIASLIKRILVVSILILISFIMFGIGPFYVFFFKNIRVTPMATQLPFVDNESGMGFTLNLIQQGALIFGGQIGIISTEMGQSLLDNVITIFPKLVRLDLDDISNELRVESMSLKTKLRLRNVLIKIQDYDR